MRQDRRLQPGGLSVANLDSGHRGSLNIAFAAVSCDSDDGLVVDVDHLADGPMSRPDHGPVGRPVRPVPAAARDAWSHRRMSKQASVAIDAYIRDAATVMVGVMRTRSAVRADVTADTEVKTASRGGLSGPEEENAQKRRQAYCNFCGIHFFLLQSLGSNHLFSSGPCLIALHASGACLQFCFPLMKGA